MILLRSYVILFRRAQYYNEQREFGPGDSRLRRYSRAVQTRRPSPYWFFIRFFSPSNVFTNLHWGSHYAGYAVIETNIIMDSRGRVFNGRLPRGWRQRRYILYG